MRTATTQTSRDHYHAQIVGVRDGQADIIYREVIRAGHYGTCIADVARLLAWEKSTVSRCFNDLKNRIPVPIELVERRKSKTTGVVSEHWRAVSSPQRRLF